MNLGDLGKQLGKLNRDRLLLQTALGLALLKGDGASMCRARLKENAEAITDTEAMIAAFGAWTAEIEGAAIARRQSSRVVPVRMKEYQDAMVAFMAAYNRHRGDRRDLLPRAHELRNLAKRCGQSAMTDLQFRFNGLPALPELHAV